MKTDATVPDPAPALSRRARVRSRRPLADEVSDLIAREYILSGAVPPGELLPSEKDLAHRYGVSRVTTRASLRTLREAGLIAVRHGVGSVVLPRSNTLMYGLDRLCSLETFAQEAGGTVSTIDPEWQEIEADDELADKLGVEPGHPVLTVQRVKTYEGVPVVWIVDFLPEGVLPFDDVKAEFNGSMLDLLLAHEEIGVDYAHAEIRAVTLPPDVAVRLEVKAGAVGLFIDELVHTVDDRIVDRGLAWHLHQHRGFFLRRRRQIGL